MSTEDVKEEFKEMSTKDVKNSDNEQCQGRFQGKTSIYSKLPLHLIGHEH